MKKILSIFLTIPNSSKYSLISVSFGEEIFSDFELFQSKTVQSQFPSYSGIWCLSVVHQPVVNFTQGHRSASECMSPYWANPVLLPISLPLWTQQGLGPTEADGRLCLALVTPFPGYTFVVLASRSLGRRLIS